MENFNKADSQPSPFIINDDDSVIHFERMKNSRSADNSEKNQEKLMEQNRKNSADDIAGMLLGSVDRKIEITREEQDGYLIQKTIITERKKLSGTARAIMNMGLSTSIRDDDIPNNMENNASSERTLNAKDSNNNQEQYQDHSQFQNYNEYSSTEDLPDNNENIAAEEDEEIGFFTKLGNFLKKVLLIIALLTILGIAGWIGWNIYNVGKAKDDYKEMISSLAPVKAQVEKCMLLEKVRYIKLCSDGEKATDGSWDLSDRFLNENRHPNFASIKISGGVITAHANYDREFRGVTFVTEPVIDHNGKINWNISDKSGCLEKQLCSK